MILKVKDLGKSGSGELAFLPGPILFLGINQFACSEVALQNGLWTARPLLRQGAGGHAAVALSSRDCSRLLRRSLQDYQTVPV